MKWILLMLSIFVLWHDGISDMVAKCLPQWDYQDGSDQCYILPSDKRTKTFDGANNYCQGHQADMVIIKDQKTLDWVISAVQSKGLGDYQVVYLNTKKMDDTWKWMKDGTAVDLSLLPLDDEQRGDCGTLTSNAHLRGVHCSESYPFMCSRGIDIPPICDYLSDWEEYSGHCYLETEDNKRWNDSLVDCQSSGGSLITINDAVEQDFAAGIVTLATAWIGMSEVGHPGVYEWADGEATNYTNWISKEQPEYGGHGGALINQIYDGKWDVYNGKSSSMYYICEKDKGACVYGWETFEDSCYYFNTEKTDVFVWENAKDTCDEVGAHLLIIDHEEENNFIKDHVAPDDPLWIGLKSQPKKDFYWIDENVMNFTRMTDKDKQEALDSNVEKCVFFQLDNPDTGDNSWVPFDCHLPRHYICEIKQGEPLHFIHHPTDKFCPDGWLMKDDFCYLLREEEKSWTDAQSYCKDNNGDLISLNTWAELDFVHYNLLDDIFIGYTDAAVEDSWVWSDGTSGDVVNWRDGEPNGGIQENCGVMYMNDGKWDDWDCDRTSFYGCERAASDTPFGPVTTTTEGPPYSENCGGVGWVENTNTGECYYVILNEADNSIATDSCASLDPDKYVDLISVSTSEEQAFIIDWLQEKHFSQQEFVIGMREGTYLGVTWFDGSPVGFFNWADGEPGSCEEDSCVEMYTATGTWNDMDCNEEHAYICEKKGPNYKPIEPPLPPEPVCPEGWTYFNSHCYYFYDTKVTWSTAQLWCESHLNSSLASIMDDAENDFLNGYAGSKNMDLWVGLHDDGTGQIWYWVDGNNMDEYTNWNDTQPDDYGGYEHCGQLRPQLGGHWNDLSCNVSNSFVCKITLDICPVGWTYHKKKCYFPIDERSTKDDARKKCKEFNTNADLVSIYDEEENMFYADIMSHGQISAWIGYTYNPDTQSWHWDDGSSNNFTFWSSGQPNLLDTDHCTMMFTSDGSWMSFKCGQTKSFGCEYFPKHYLACEDGWKYFNGSCYYIPHNSSLSFDEAKEDCASRGAQLASIHSEEENAFVFANLDEYADLGTLIGVNDVGHRGDMTWTDGTAFTYSKWECATAEQFDISNCGVMQLHSHWWRLSTCDAMYSHVCEKPPEAKEVNPTESGCHDGDLYFKGSCYNIPDQKLSWDDATQACESSSAHIVKIEEDHEGAFFSANLGDYGADAWIDAKVHRYEDESADFIFDDGSLITFLPWDANQPDLITGDCIFITGTLGHSGFYHVSQCETQRNFICEYDRDGYTTPIPEPTPTHGTFCYDGWRHNAGHCYQVFSDPVIWADGEAACQSYGGHLASINSQDEESAILNVINSTSLSPHVSSLWVGLQLDTEADKHWTDGSSIDFLHWEDDQPILHDHENCASADKNDLKLSCSVCESHLPYVCEALEGSKISTLAPPTFEPPSKCDDGVGDWYLYNDHCYKFVSEVDEDPQSWEMSNQLCQAEGSYLTSVGDIDENYFIESMIYQLSDEGIWLGGRSTEDSGWEWLDGSPFKYDHWAPGEPNHLLDQEDCIEMYILREGKWNDMNCGHLNGRVCKRPYGAILTTPKPTLPPAGNCPEGWVHAVTTGRCFLFNDTDMNFDDATQACKGINPNANLASIHTPKEMAYITAGIGMLVREAWIGLKYEAGEYVWVDQTSVDYTPWAPGQPDGQSAAEDCTKSVYPSGKMNDINCNEMNGYICAMKQDPSIIEPASFPKCGAPYDNYFQYLDDCYRAEKTAKSWLEAEKTCAAEGSHLASVNDVNENALIWILAQDGDTQHPWIGLNNYRDNTTYEWSDNWPVLYTNWGDNEPTINTTDQNCVRIHSDDGLWYNEKCDELRPFLCKHSEDEAPTPDPPVTGYCPDGPWIDFKGGFCYMIVQDQMIFSGANTYCAFMDSNLTSIHSDGETELLLRAIKQLSSNIWIGLIQKTNGLGWSDWTAYNYLNWQTDEPSSEDEKCTEFSSKDGKWNDLLCDDLRPFVCKTPKIQDPEPTNPTFPTSPTLPPFVDTTTHSGGGDNGLSKGAISGIVISILLVVAAVGYIGGFYVTKKKTKKQGNINSVLPKNTSAVKFDLNNLTDEADA